MKGKWYLSKEEEDRVLTSVVTEAFISSSCEDNSPFLVPGLQ